MGRPKKDVTVPKIETEVPEFLKQPVEEKVVENPQTVKFTATAFGITKDPATGYWHVVKIPYDFKTKTVGTPEQIGQGDDRSIAIERFKIEAGTNLMGEF